MPDAAWKAWEREVAARLGGRRRGQAGREASDLVLPGWSVEVKLRSRIGLAEIEEALAQAERAAAEGERAVAVLRQPRRPARTAIAVMRLETLAAIVEALRSRDA